MEAQHSLQHAGSKDKNITQVKTHSHFCLIVSHVECVHYMCMCGPEPPPTECQERHKLQASDCMSRFQKEPTFLNKGFIAAQEPRDGLFLCFIFVFLYAYYYYCCWYCCYNTQCLMVQVSHAQVSFVDCSSCVVCHYHVLPESRLAIHSSLCKNFDVFSLSSGIDPGSAFVVLELDPWEERWKEALASVSSFTVLSFGLALPWYFFLY